MASGIAYNIVDTLRKLTDSAKESGDFGLVNRCESLSQEYRYMLEFIASGGKDDNRGRFLDSFRTRVNELRCDIDRRKAFMAIPAHESVFAQIKDVDTSASALIDSLKDNTLSPSEHHDALSRAFSAILFSYGWNQREQRMWMACLIAPDTNSIDAQTLMSAIMLSCRIQFCMEKFRTMAYVYLTTDDEALRQRSLVGWCSCLENLDDDTLASELFESENTRREVLKLVMQMVASTAADEDGKKIQREIMPELLKHQMKSGILSDDIIKSSEETLSDILNPGREEQEMEDVEKSIGKMTDMMKNGSDIFFGEFSKMKRYPFFYKPVNWFMPFTYDHPHLAEARKKLDGVKSLDHIYRNGPFCDSDKYSFTFGLSSVISSLPDKIREMLSTGEVGPLGTLPQGSEREITPDYLRRMYVQDLYRFYNLSPQLKLSTIFTPEVFFTSFYYADMKPLLIDFGKFLMRRGYYTLMEHIDKYYVEEVDEASYPDFCLLMASWHRAMGRAGHARIYYREAYERDMENEAALRGYARCSLELDDYDKAAALYDILCEKHPENLAFAQNRMLASVSAGKASEMINEIYRLDIENENNISIKRLLAWVLMCNGRMEQAESLYNEILRGDYGKAAAGDHLSIVELYWVSDHQKQAIDTLRQLLSNMELGVDTAQCQELIRVDLQRLERYFNICKDDAMLMIEAATLS